MPLSADTNLVFELGNLTTVPVKASAQIYLGAAVGLTSGYARGLVAGDDFAGFAAENKLGTTDGAVNCAVSTSGQVQLSISSIAVTDIGKAVYASADGTFTLTQGSNSKIGTVSRWVSTGVAIVRYAAQGAGADLSGVTVLTDNSGGAAADGTIGAVTAPTALTDNGGGTADATVEVMTAAAAITDNSGGTNATDTIDVLADAGGTAAGAPTTASVGAAIKCLSIHANTNSTAIGAIKNNMKELTTRQAENRTAIVALTDAVKELSTKLNEAINALK